MLGAPVPVAMVSAEVASSGAAQDAQKRLFWGHSFEQAGHRTIRLDTHLSASARQKNLLAADYAD
jgi:hypothetical protein